MHAGIGIRDPYPEAGEASYLDPTTLGLSSELIKQIEHWLKDYSTEFFAGFKNSQEIRRLDGVGLRIRDSLANEYPHAKIDYFSDALMKKVRRS